MTPHTMTVRRVLHRRRRSAPGAERAHRLTAQFVGPTTPGGEPVRRLRIAPPRQLMLVFDPSARADTASLWDSLPERSREVVLRVLASMITTGIVDDSAGEEAS